jgi:hypothetical protein
MIGKGSFWYRFLLMTLVFELSCFSLTMGRDIVSFSKESPLDFVHLTLLFHKPVVQERVVGWDAVPPPEQLSQAPKTMTNRPQVPHFELHAIGNATLVSQARGDSWRCPISKEELSDPTFIHTLSRLP